MLPPGYADATPPRAAAPPRCRRSYDVFEISDAITPPPVYARFCRLPRLAMDAAMPRHALIRASRYDSACRHMSVTPRLRQMLRARC